MVCTVTDRNGHSKADLTGIHVSSLCMELYLQTRAIPVRSGIQRGYKMRNGFGTILEVVYIYKLINFISLCLKMSFNSAMYTITHTMTLYIHAWSLMDDFMYNK